LFWKPEDCHLGHSYFSKPHSVLSNILVMQVELEDPVENIGAKLVRQAAAKTNDLAGDETTTSVVLAQGLIAEGVKVCPPLGAQYCYLYILSVAILYT
jgi:hypothetical protein